MMIKLTGGWVSVEHIQAITPIEGGGTLVHFLDAKIVLKEDVDDVANRVNEIRATISVLRELYTQGDELEAAEMLRSLASKNSQTEGKTDGEEESED